MSTPRKHYKHPAESEIGNGTIYLEAQGDVIPLSDQPLSWLDLDSDDAITASQFEAVWKQAKAVSG